MLFVPLYTMVFPLLGYHLSPVQAVEVSLVIEIFGFTSSVSAFWRAGFIDFQISLFAVMLAAPLAIVGGLVSHLLPGNILLALIGFALVGFGYLLVGESAEHHLVETDGAAQPGGPKIKEHRDRQGRVYRYRLLNDGWRATAAGFGGILQGLVGFSAGELSTVEQVLRGMPVRIAAGNSHMIIFAAATAAAFTHLSVSAAQGTTVPWNIIAASAPAVLIGGQFAGKLAGRIPQEILRLILAGFLTFIGLISAYRASVGSRLHIPVWILAVSVVVCLSAIVLVITRQNRRRAAVKACEAAAGSCCLCVPQDPEVTQARTSD
ncbi:MAG: sulfite exporter TauE/SafE family protein [Bryobacterales bacterium]|nr:sulfite exporter TauE/SafE family protein [Bryobacterales bacterium]